MALETLKEIEDEEEELEISKKACKLDAHLLDIARPLASQKKYTAAIWPFENCLPTMKCFAHLVIFCRF